MLISQEINTDQNTFEWQQFIKTGSCLDNKVRMPILDSWERCFQLGINPYNNSKHFSLVKEQVRDSLAKNKDLLNIARPLMENLYSIVAGTGFVVVLTDASGYILELFADRDQPLMNPITTNFFAGACWSEAVAGTNAIGTAMVIKEPVQINGSEHYCYKHHCLTCSAAPILDADGNLIGILDISGASNASHLHTLGMVTAAAASIMAQMAILEKNKELKNINRQLTSVFDSISDAVLIIDHEGNITKLNLVAEKILCPSGQNVIGMFPDELFGWQYSLTKKMLKNKEPFHDVEIAPDKAAPHIEHCLVSGVPIVNEKGRADGGVITLKPVAKIKKLASKLNNLAEKRSWQFQDIVGNSEGMIEAGRLANLAAATTANVLLYGESGTGKEIFAQAIHNKSSRQDGPFVAVNCGAIPKELIASELFGYEDGSFTGARKGGKEGKFEIASGGTLFLDEIGDMPLEQQIALLRVLQERKITHVGGHKEIAIDIRIICATHKSLPEQIALGNFRQDLYYRLNVVPITIPPLRERGRDILLLFNYFLEKLNVFPKRNFILDSKVNERLLEYPWPGNVRELQNTAERIVSLMQGSVILPEHLPQEIQFFNQLSQANALPEITMETAPSSLNSSRAHFRQIRTEIEKREILYWLKASSGNVSFTAKKIGISRNTLYRKMKTYGIDN